MTIRECRRPTAPAQSSSAKRSDVHLVSAGDGLPSRAASRGRGSAERSVPMVALVAISMAPHATAAQSPALRLTRYFSIADWSSQLAAMRQLLLVVQLDDAESTRLRRSKCFGK